MIKNGSKLFAAAVILCFCIVLSFFALRSMGIPLFNSLYEIMISEVSPSKWQKIDLNSVSAEDIQQIPGVSSSLARAIIHYREKYGNYVDTDELMQIDGISYELYQTIIQYVCVGGAS